MNKIITEEMFKAQTYGVFAALPIDTFNKLINSKTREQINKIYTENHQLFIYSSEYPKFDKNTIIKTPFLLRGDSENYKKRQEYIEERYA